MWNIPISVLPEEVRGEASRLGPMLQEPTWTEFDLMMLHPYQIIIGNMLFNHYSWATIQRLLGITSPNTIKAIILLTARSQIWEKGRHGGSYSMISPIIIRELGNVVRRQRHGLNCMKTIEAKALVLDQLEAVKKRGIERLSIWSSFGMVSEFKKQCDEFELTHDVFQDICKKCDIFIAKGEKLEYLRRRCCNHQAINVFFSTISTVINNIPPSYIFNADETGMSSNRAFRILTDDLQLRVTQADIEQSHISAMLCFSAAGATMEPFLIFPKRETAFDELSDIDDITIATSSNGWMTSHLWDIWTILFVSYISRRREENVLERDKAVILFVDGHASRLSPFGMRLLKRFNVICIVFPSHSTHVLQPFDVCIAAPLKNRYLKLLLDRLVIALSTKGEYNPTQQFRRRRVLAFVNAWKEVNQIRCMKAFHDAGLVPLNQENIAMKHLIADPIMPEDESLRVRLSPINGKIATENLNQFEPLRMRKMNSLNQFEIKDINPDDITPELIALQWYSGDSSQGKVFNELCPIFDKGMNIVHSFRRRL